MMFKSEKIRIDEEKLDINLIFYFFLKCLVKIKYSDHKVLDLLKIYAEKRLNLDEFKKCLLQDFDQQDNKSALQRRQLLGSMLDEVVDELRLKTFMFALKLYSIKDLLLQEAKIKITSDYSRLAHLHPLSLEYDKITVFEPYTTRVNGALLSLIFFEKLENKQTDFVSEESEALIKALSNEAIELKESGIEPNQIFMLMFSESVNQSITSDSGSDYEERISNVLKSIGIPEDKITKVHDEIDSSTEFDFFIHLNNRTYGIGAKRTLRERYKQFIKTAQMSELDVMIEITLGTDLTVEKVNSIVSHGVYLFVADEIYQENKYLQDKEGVFSCNDLSITLLHSLKTLDSIKLSGSI